MGIYSANFEQQLMEQIESVILQDWHLDDYFQRCLEEHDQSKKQYKKEIESVREGIETVEFRKSIEGKK